MGGENRFFINLGDKWGHVLELTELLAIKHIHNDEDGYMSITCNTAGDGNETTTYKSTYKFLPEDIPKEKQKLIRYASGYVTKEDFNEIISIMDARTGKKTKKMSDSEWIDIEALRKMFYDVNEIPYYRMVIDFSGESGEVNIKADSNLFFDRMAVSWLEENGVEGAQNAEDARLLFGAEIIQNQVDALFPSEEEEDISMDVPAKTISVRGTPKQQVDIAKIRPENRYAITQ